MKLLYAFALMLIAGVSTAQSVSMVLQSVDKVYSGSDMIVNVHINKGNLDGFGRLVVKIPVGFTPIEKNSENGKFEFDGESVKIIWIKMPAASQFTVSFSVKIPPQAEGYKVLRGELSVAADRESFRAEARPHIVVVEKSDGIATADDMFIEYSYIKKLGVSAIRQKPYLNDSNVVVVNILLNKGALVNFGKIEESIPPGYTAESIVSNTAIFVFNKAKRQVKFLWMNLPTPEQFIVSYILKPDEGQLDDIPFIITGEFMYAEGATTKTVEVNERNVDLQKLMGK